MLPNTQGAPTLGVQEVSYSLTIDLHIAHLSGRSKQDVREPLAMLPEKLTSVEEDSYLQLRHGKHGAKAEYASSLVLSPTQGGGSNH